MTRRGAPGSNDDTAERWHQRGSYCPASYKTAYRRIVRGLRERGIEFAAVWHVEAGADAWDWQSFYPGDAYVDWIGTSLFYLDHIAYESEPSANYLSQEAVLDFAAARNKPVMIAESSPIQHGVAIYPNQLAQGARPELKFHTCPDTEAEGEGEGETPGEQAWNLWFEPYFNYIQSHDSVKAISYINNDWSDAGEYSVWRKDARIGESGDIAVRFQAKMRETKYRHLSDIPEEFAMCRSHTFRVKGADWLRFLPTGDIATSEGRIQANSPYKHTYPPPVFAIVNRDGMPLLAIYPEAGEEKGNVYLRGAFQQEASITPPTEAHWRFDVGSSPIALLDLQGNLHITGEELERETFVAPEIKYRPFPAEYHGYECGPDSNKSRPDCDCFMGTTWSIENPCDYSGTGGNQKGAPQTEYTAMSASNTVVLYVDSYGDLVIPNGAAHADGAVQPTGSEVLLLGTCDGQQQASIVVDEVGSVEEAHLWLTGRVKVATSPASDPAACWELLGTDGEVLAQIDGDGNLSLSGIVYVNGVSYKDAYNYPTKSGGALLYD